MYPNERHITIASSLVKFWSQTRSHLPLLNTSITPSLGLDPPYRRTGISEIKRMKNIITIQSSSWPWSHGSWIYNYLCNQCISPLMLLVRIPIRTSCTTLCDKVCQWLVTGRWFNPDPLVSSTNKTDRYSRNIVESGVKHHKTKPTKLSYHTLGSVLKSNIKIVTQITHDRSKSNCQYQINTGIVCNNLT